jgi:hypothetical protein
MKLAILARGSTLSEFPGNDQFDEVWGLNRVGETHDLDRLYVMDDLKLRLPHFEGPEFLEWLKDYPGRLITSKKYDEWPTSEEFPIIETAKYFGLPLGIAMYSTVDYMMAAAIMEGVDEIHTYGVDCPYNIVTDVVRTSIAVWIGAALARGILVTSRYESFSQWWTHVGLITEQGLYGYTGKPRIENLVN